MNDSDFRLPRFKAAAWAFLGKLIPAVEGVVSLQLDHQKIKPHLTSTVGSPLRLQLMMSFLIHTG